MARVAIVMPKSGYEMETGTIVSWLKDVGDPVARGEPIAEIETDKATAEMDAAASGILVAVVHAAGAEVPVGATIGWLEVDE